DLYQLSCGKIAYFDVFREIKRKLVDRGIPADEIAIINDYKTDKQRQELFDLVNKGDVRVIMGTTQRLGTGVNMQERLAVEHDLDAPFRPADAEQRTGRLVRQGNILPEVEVLRYGMEETLDAGMYQILTRKQKFINDALKGRRRNMDELNDSAVDYASFSAQISGNPMLMRKVELETRLRELQALEYQFRRSIRRDVDLKAELQRAIPHIEEDIIKLKELAAHPFSTEFPEIEINGIKLDGTTEYKVKQLTSHMMQKGLFPALQKAKADFEDTIIPAGFVKINGIEIELNAHCPVESYRVREDKLAIRYHLTGHDFYNRKIKLGSEVTTGNGLITSLKSILAHKAEEAVNEADQLKLNRQRLQQLQDSDRQKVFKYADERIQLQKELDQILYELNEKDLLHEDKTFAAMPRLSDYLDLGIELITQETEVSDDDDESEENEEVCTNECIKREMIAKVIQKKSKMQLQRDVKGNLRQLPAVVTAENAPFADQSRCTFRFLKTFVIISKARAVPLVLWTASQTAGVPTSFVSRTPPRKLWTASQTAGVPTVSRFLCERTRCSRTRNQYQQDKEKDKWLLTQESTVFRSSMQEASKDTKKITPVWKLTATSPMESTICSLKFSKRSFDIMKKVYQQCCKCKTIYESDCKVVPYAYCIMKNCGGLVPYEASRQEELKNKFNKTERKTK
ncbi:MAG: hypothetical protein IKB71_01610, partial [Lentisphaeria bacterium]|nr:hypothetical protein [Lentisphaeria bacterium]